MIRFLTCAWVLAVLTANAQNESDVIRYSQINPNGSARYNAMGGAFGALGADVGCASTNPAGLAIFRKGEVSYSAGSKVLNSKTKLHNKETKNIKGDFAFSNFGIVAAWAPEANKDSRNAIGFTVSKLADFNSAIKMSAYTNSASIAADMLNIVNEVKDPGNFNNYYEGLAFDAFMIDYDPKSKRYFSNVDLRRTVQQSRNIVTSGRVNEIGISFAHSFDDNFYFGGSLGVPQLRYASTTTHIEKDDKDSMRVTVTSAESYTTTYLDGLPLIKTGWLGFNNLSYTEYFKTTGQGVNLKLGFVARINDSWRVGAYYHTSTYYSLNDVYYNSVKMAFDGNVSNPVEVRFPDKDGSYDYSMVSPSRFGLSGAYIYKKLLAVGLDYENVNYKVSRLEGENATDFENVNDYMSNNFKNGHSIRLGAELNAQPVMFRIGYNMIGNSYGEVFTGSGVRNLLSLGAGFRTKGNFSFDVAWIGNYSREDYYLFRSFNTKADISLRNSSLVGTFGYRF